MENLNKTDIGLIGLAVMGENLALNMADKGWRVSVYNRTVPGIEEGVVERFINGRAQGKSIEGYTDIARFVESVAVPRKIMMMVRAGSAVDELMEQLFPLLSPGDILIDGGNSNYEDTNRRVALAEARGFRFVGAGVSGGEEGALNGASIMPGGSVSAWEEVKPVLQSIAAKASDGPPCCQWVGPAGSGHFVKMIHNGIEYGDMQLICEAYQMMRDGMGMSSAQMHKVFEAWNHSELDSYLMEITADIMGYQDENGETTVEKILDVAGQKGTGKWTCIAALDEKAHNQVDEARKLMDSVATDPALKSMSEMDRMTESMKRYAMAKNKLENSEASIRRMEKLKHGSVANISQIATVSKLRIKEPVTPHSVLCGVKVSERDMEQIEKALLELYISKGVVKKIFGNSENIG